jgi:hypothetical protein
MDEELKQHLEAMEGRIIANVDAMGGPANAHLAIDAHVNDSPAAYESNIVAALIDMRDTLTRGLDNGFEQMHRRFDAVDARFDAQDRMQDRQDVLIDEIEESVRVMNDDIERMDKLLARRAS